MEMERIVSLSLIAQSECQFSALFRAWASSAGSFDSKDHFMKKIAGYFIALSLVLALPSAKVWAKTKPFEGTITWTMTVP